MSTIDRFISTVRRPLSADDPTVHRPPAAAVLARAGGSIRSSRSARLATRIADLLLPSACPLCEMPAPGAGATLCQWCLSALPGIDRPRCRRCALVLGPAGSCQACARHPPAMDHAIALADFAPPLAGLVRALKYRDRTALATPLGAALAGQIAARQPSPGWPEIIVPVPLSDARLRERGYNQALLLARVLGRALNRPVGAQLLRRIDGHARDPVTGRPRAARQQALTGAMTGAPELWGRRVAIVDDVMTTGATLRAATEAARAAGAATVSAWVLARTA